MRHNHAVTFPRRITSLAAIGIVSVAGFAACGDDDDSPDGTDIETITSDVTANSEVTLGTTVSSEVEVTDIETDDSEVEVTDIETDVSEVEVSTGD